MVGVGFWISVGGSESEPGEHPPSPILGSLSVSLTGIDADFHCGLTTHTACTTHRHRHLSYPSLLHSLPLLSPLPVHHAHAHAYPWIPPHLSFSLGLWVFSYYKMNPPKKKGEDEHVV